MILQAKKKNEKKRKYFRNPAKLGKAQADEKNIATQTRVNDDLNYLKKGN